MGSPPPKDNPPPEEQDIVTADAGFESGPDAIDLCGFKFPPLFKFSFGLNLPSIQLPTFNFNLAIGLSCSTNPFDMSAGVKYGGGRVGSGPKDPDDADREEYLAK